MWFSCHVKSGVPTRPACTDTETWKHATGLKRGAHCIRCMKSCHKERQGGKRRCHRRNMLGTRGRSLRTAGGKNLKKSGRMRCTRDRGRRRRKTDERRGFAARIVLKQRKEALTHPTRVRRVRSLHREGNGSAAVRRRGGDRMTTPMAGRVRARRHHVEPRQQRIDGKDQRQRPRFQAETPAF